jgi:uncharacterized membrane protein
MIWIQDLYFEAPQLLWAIPLALLIGAILISRRAKGKLFAFSRLLVFCLIIAAAANPYFVELHTVSSQKPSITILDDQTGSMNIFDPLAASRVEKYVDAHLRAFSGDATPLGDKIVEYSLPGNSLLLVSDGYSNSGRSLEDALELARASNTTTFAISIAPQRDDAGVEISGTNTAVLAGDYPFKVLVRSSRGYQGPISVFADERLIYSDTIAANNSASIKISHSFLETGNHIIRAAIAPDGQPINDNYQKSVYVVPKPQVLLLSSSNSPLATELNDLYKLTLVSDLPDGLEGYKAVVLDDIKYSTHLDELKSYVREGGGLVVVGGENSYENGNYRNSSLEEILPVRSMPSIFEGGKTLIFVIDISFSLLTTRTADGTPLLDYEKSLAVEMLKSPHFQDYKVGLIVFGTKAYDVQDPVPLRRAESVLRERIMSLAPTGTENSYLDSGLQLAWDMLNVSGGQGELMILSDGNLYNYPEVVDRSIDLLRQMNVTARLVQVQAFSGATGRFDYLASKTGSDYSAFVYPDSLTTTMQQPPEQASPEESSPSGYAVGVVNKNHYITADLDLNATVTGFNDVTPRAGAQRLAALPDGKPVLTVWRYGLGRVAALTVDDGSAWAGNLYSSKSSQLISATLNWAVGDPRSQEDRIEADDGWTGSPLSITINSPARPSFPEADVEKVGDNRYVATFVPNSSGIYYIGNYGLAVNYPREYRDIGVNPDFSRMIMANGGKVFSEEQAREKLVVEASRVSQRTLQVRISRRDILLLIALLIFLTEIIYRKMNEFRRKGRSRA